MCHISGGRLAVEAHKFRRENFFNSISEMQLSRKKKILPPPLERGARVALVAPAGIIRKKEDVTHAEENVRSLGWIPVTGSRCLNTFGFFAGTDADRCSDLNNALHDDSVDGIWCVRGGYGAMRILENLDYDAMTSRPRALIGFSDITALHSAFFRNSEVVTFHGPTARGTLSDFSRDSLVRAVVTQKDPCGTAQNARIIKSGIAHGTLVGGNLALVTSLIGTHYAYNPSEYILALEDVNEPVYRVDRMMQQMLLSGALANCAGMAIGDFSLPKDDDEDSSRTVDEVMSEIADRLGIPCLAGLPIGHIDDQWTIPIGVEAELNTETKALNVLMNA